MELRPVLARRPLVLVALLAVGAVLLAVPARSSAADAAPLGTITGEAWIESEGPTPGLRVSARPFDAGPDAPETDSTVSAADGSYSLDVPAGEYLVTLHSSEFAYSSGVAPFDFDHWSQGPGKWSTDRLAKARPVVVSDDDTTNDVDLMAWPPMGFEGVVTSAAEPALLKDVEVTLRERDGTVVARQTIGTGTSSARYAFGSLRTGTYTVGVRRGGVVDEPSAASVTVVVDTGNTQSAPEIRLQRYTRNTTRPTTSTQTPRIGVPLSATTGEWTRTEGVTWRYQWFMDGTAIDAGKQAQYSPSPGTLGKALTVRVTAVHDGDVVASATSIATSRTAPGTIEVLRDPALAAARYPVVGDRLGRDLGHWTPSGLTWAYQWLRDGSAVSGQRASSYLLTSADWGKDVSLRVTGSRTGYTSATRTTDPVLVKRAPSMSNTTTVLGGGKVQLTAKVVVVGTTRPSGSVDVLEDDEKIATIPSLTNGTGTITVSGRTPGAHRYTLAYSGNRLVVPASRSRDVVVR